jgi:hypothetical protein
MVLLAMCFGQVPIAVAEVGKTQHLDIEIRSEGFADRARGYVVTGDKASPEVMEKYAKLWAIEWSKYSADVMRKARVNKIVFCEALALSGQARAAVPAFDLNTMYYDPALGSYSPSYQRGVIHHEFFHMMDQRMKTLDRDKAWGALNAKGFRYESGGDKMRTPGVGNLTKAIPGFLTLYGTSAMEEDKAELYAHLITDPGFVEEQAKTDLILAAKIGLLKRKLAEFDPWFGDSFWPKG